jgi:signal transduction histidine kinase
MKSFGVRDISIRWKVAAIILVLVAISLLLAGAGLLLHARAAFEREVVQELTLVGDVVGSNSTAALTFRDRRAATQTLAALGNDERIMIGGVYDQNGRLFASYRRADVDLALPDVAPLGDAPTFAHGRVALTRSVELKGEPIGNVYVVADTREWSNALRAFLVILVTLFSMVLAVGLLVSLGLRFVTRPIEDLAHLMNRMVRERDFSLRARKRGNDEIGALVDGFNNMLEEIGSRRAEAERAQRELKTRVAELDAEVKERRRAEEELRRHTDELQRSNRELGQFAYVASHDLQEPLRAISGCVQLLAQRYRDKLDGRANELIEHTVSGALRMQALINDLLSYSRVSTRARPFEMCDVSEPLRQALANLEFAAKEASATVTSDPMPVASIDPTQLTQLFQNLIGNAFKFRAERAPKVHVGAQLKPGGYVFSVHDNGIGIEPQYIDRIFGVFQRLHNRNQYPGNGIGLAICRKIIERHNGRIWVDSTPGEGSTFYFTLPVGSVHHVEPSERFSSQQH